MKKVRAGVIGTGVMGGFHARQYANIDNAELIGIFDLDKTKAQETADKYQTKAFNKLDDIFPLVDALSIATPTSTHYKIGIACLEAGKHLLIEKPITLDEKEAEELISIAKNKGLVLAVGHIERFNPAYKKFQELVREKGIEIINIIDAKRLSPYPARITDASVVLDIMIHDLDLVLNLVDSKISKITAKGEKIRSNSLDKVSASVTFENGVIANIEADRVHEKKVRDFNVSVHGHSYEMDFIKKEIIRKQEHTTEKVEVSLYDQLQFELTDFISAIIEERKPLVTGEEGLEVLKFANQIEKLSLL